MRYLAILLLPFIILANSCYEIYELDDENELESAVFILLDETAYFDNISIDQISEGVRNLVDKNTYFYIAKFSAFIDGFYNQKIFDIKVEDNLPKEIEYKTSKSKLNKFKKCLRDQKPYAKKMISSKILEVLQNNELEIPKSEIVNGLKDYSEVIKRNKAKDKIVIIASDMLENSDLTSFYSKGALRNLDFKKELEKVEKAGLFSDFGGARVFVIGAGLTKDKNGYKNSKTLENFKDFWQSFFKNSNANLVEFGMPTLKGDIY